MRRACSNAESSKSSFHCIIGCLGENRAKGTPDQVDLLCQFGYNRLPMKTRLFHSIVVIGSGLFLGSCAQPKETPLPEEKPSTEIKENVAQSKPASKPATPISPVSSAPTSVPVSAPA